MTHRGAQNETSSSQEGENSHAMNGADHCKAYSNKRGEWAYHPVLNTTMIAPYKHSAWVRTLQVVSIAFRHRKYGI